MGTSTRTVAVTPRQPQHESDSLSLGLSEALEDWSLDDSSDWLSEIDDSDDEDSDGLDELSEGLDELSEELSDAELLLSERLDDSLQLLELLDSSISQQLPSRTMAQQTPLFFSFQRICVDPSRHVCR